MPSCVAGKGHRTPDNMLSPRKLIDLLDNFHSQLVYTFGKFQPRRHLWQ